jgi:hypothetical protein
MGLICSTPFANEHPTVADSTLARVASGTITIKGWQVKDQPFHHFVLRYASDSGKVNSALDLSPASYGETFHAVHRFTGTDSYLLMIENLDADIKIYRIIGLIGSRLKLLTTVRTRGDLRLVANGRTCKAVEFWDAELAAWHGLKPGVDGFRLAKNGLEREFTFSSDGAAIKVTGPK